MALVYKDRVKETTTTTGTGTLTLAGAVSGYQAFSAVGNANTCVYGLEASDNGWEVGIGTYTLSGTTLARTTILASSNAGNAITLPAGTHNVFVTADASRMSHLQSLYNDHAFIITQSGNTSSQQTLTASTYTSVEGDVLDTSVIDRSSAVTNVGTGGSAVTFTAPEAGIYQMGGLIVVFPMSADSRLIVLLGINDADTDAKRLIISRGWNNLGPSGVAAFGGSHMIKLAANDTVKLQCWTDSSGTPTLVSEDNRIYFYGRFVSRST